MKQLEEMDLNAIGERLRKVRLSLNFSIMKISDLTGFSKSLISDIENGKKKPSSIYLFGLVTLFKINTNYILTGEGSVFLDEPPGYDRDIGEMVELMQKVDLVKYSMLSFFIDFKTRNKDVIDVLLKETEKKKRKRRLSNER